MSSVFIISAPSGSGKTTLVSRLMREVPNLRFSISYTTRSPRGQEKEGQGYHFISREDFEARIAKGEFLEHAEVFGNYYGTHRSVLDLARKEGTDLILDIDVQGASQLRESVPAALSIFILPPSRQVLEERLRRRSEDPDAVIERRLRDAAREIRNCTEYDFILVNDQLEESARTLSGIVLAERARRESVTPQILPILKTFE